MRKAILHFATSGSVQSLDIAVDGGVIMAADDPADDLGGAVERLS